MENEPKPTSMIRSPFFAATLISLPVCGLRPVRAARLLMETLRRDRLLAKATLSRHKALLNPIQNQG